MVGCESGPGPPCDGHGSEDDLYDEPSAGLDPIVAAGLDDPSARWNDLQSHQHRGDPRDGERQDHRRPGLCLHKVPGGRHRVLAELEQSDHPYVQQFFARRPDTQDSADTAYARSLTDID